MRRSCLAVCVAVVASCCGGSGGASVPSGGTSSAVSPTPVVAVQGGVTGCHRKRDGDVVISIRTTLLDPAAIHGYQGRLDFHGSLASPTSWTRVPGKPELKDLADRQAAVFWLIVPKGEPVPDTLTMHVQVEAIDSIETANATSLDSLAGQQVSTPFGAASLAAVHPSSHSLTISLRPPAVGLGAGVKSLGPRIATLDVAGRNVVARVSPGPDGTDSLVFDTASSATGSVALTLGAWTFDLPSDVPISVPASSCAAA